jgi:hypothetical protein
MDMAFHSSFELSGSPGTSLRPLGWAELCARLVASQDFRAARAIEGARNEQPPSFHGTAAQWLAMLPASAAERAAGWVHENEVDVNPTHSVAGQSVSGIALPEPGGATSTTSAHRTESEMSS